ncbi:MAG: hypothetical protein QOF21_2571, partial [Actinomycetota bacterium]
VNGQSARAMDSSVVGSTVSWHQDGYEVGVIGESGASDDVLDVARRVRLAAAGRAEDTRLDGVPAGMAIIGDGGFGAYPRIRYLINAVGDGAGTNASVNIDVSLVPSGLPAAILGAGTELDATRQARGHAAFLFRQSTDIGGHTLEQVTLSWAERPDLLVVIGGTITGDDAVAIAHGLREETEQKWRSQLPVRDQAP